MKLVSSSIQHTSAARDAEEGPASGRRLVTRQGASTEVALDADGERIQVRDPVGRLIFEYHPETGRSVITVPSGDLSFAAPNGDIDLVAGGEVRCRGARGVTIAGGAEDDAAKLDLAGSEARLGARRLEVSGERAELLFAEATYHGVRLSAAVDQARIVASRIETLAVDVFERVKRSIRRVEEVDQLEAGRVRALVTGSYSVRSGHASIVADDDVAIDGKRVHLG